MQARSSKEKVTDKFVRDSLQNLGLVFNRDFFEQDAKDCLKETLKGASKTGGGQGIPDFTVELYKGTKGAKKIIPVVIENKPRLEKLLSGTKDRPHLDRKAISDYALNGALHYAKFVVQSEHYDECIAVGVAGDDPDHMALGVYFVMGGIEPTYKPLPHTNFNFLENKEAWTAFYDSITLSEEEKHEILITSLKELEAQSKKLNKLMQSLNITAPQRVLYVSGMLLSMQDMDEVEGLRPEDLKGVTRIDSERDGVKITSRIRALLEAKNLEKTKLGLMLSSFSEIDKDPQRDAPQTPDKEIARLLPENASINKQVFTFIYKNIHSALDKYSSHLDFIGELYSEFLKYALGDGKELGIVLTPPYVTKAMTRLLEVDKDSRVMDLATGSAGFLISAMQLMMDSIEGEFGHGSEAQRRIRLVKEDQLLGVELNAEMFALATTNMILRGDGSSKIHKGCSFSSELESTIKDFEATRLLLNPPFTHEENGMPFIKKGLDNMPPHSLGAIIIQDSAGSGKAPKTNQSLLRRHTLLASIKMPMDLFQPMAGVQTSIYIFKAGVPHDFDRPVKFIDFRNDGYKRTGRSLLEIDNPKQRYSDLVTIYKQGLRAKIKNDYKDPMHLESIYIEDFIDSSGKDWNFEAHQKIDSKPKLEDFKKCVGDYLSFEVAQILKGEALNF